MTQIGVEPPEPKALACSLDVRRAHRPTVRATILVVEPPMRPPHQPTRASAVGDLCRDATGLLETLGVDEDAGPPVGR